MTDIPAPTVAGIVLCGGQSQRMGSNKALLPFGDETMIERVIRILNSVVSPIVVVAGHDTKLPPLPDSIIVTHDRQPNQGPLEGIRMGLAAIKHTATAAFVTGCDVPLLVPSFIQTLIDQLGNGEHDVAVASEDGFLHPLAAVYRTHLIPVIDELLTAQRRRPLFLYDQVATNPVSTDLLIKADPQLASLANLNQANDYFAALEQAGLIAEPHVVKTLQQLNQ
ncbi:MAG: molybdenum cofactor guanylyltransferase [Planctomycetaceae bacterium]|jgi:molybdenum cofactor guanylyltransferase|nr:molybdenum cofactor guanylyltransferase [Planctomycetaceae bacterium]